MLLRSKCDVLHGLRSRFFVCCFCFVSFCLFVLLLLFRIVYLNGFLFFFFGIVGLFLHGF